MWTETNWGTYGDNLSHGGINMWVNRQAASTTVTISFPDNAIARESVHRYIAALARAFKRVVKGSSDQPGVVAPQGESDGLYALTAE